ncbi:GntR family transcriptional regulator [Solimonas soli]|uniref:GntR family transcriptional regulator n=1 Tax=Solimonas soli TaxID=413479 RepID=UPI0004ADC00A|nr:GntR family transcriptional regulator [Solimonas soli]
MIVDNQSSHGAASAELVGGDGDAAAELPLIQQTVRRLLRDILVGVYQPGARIREADVAQRLGISRAPVREALRVLERDGLIELAPWRGARVIDPAPAEIADLFDLLGVAHGAVARFAVRHASDEQLRQYAEAIDALEALIRGGRKNVELVDAAYRAGTLLAEACGSRQAAAMQRRVGRVAYWLHRFLQPAPSRWRQQSLARHRKLVTALRARSEIAAEKAARRVVEHTRTLVLQRAQAHAAGPAR